MNNAIRSLALAGAFALAACGTESPVENAAENQASMMENQAETMENQAEAMNNQAAANALENQADALENKADATREAGEEAADQPRR